MEIKEKKRNLAIISLIVAMIIIGIIGFAYARYITINEGQTTTQIAEWSFKVTDGTHNDNIWTK